MTHERRRSRGGPCSPPRPEARPPSASPTRLSLSPGRSSMQSQPWTLPAHDLAASRCLGGGRRHGRERWRAHLAGGVTGAPLIQAGTVLGAPPSAATSQRSTSPAASSAGGSSLGTAHLRHATTGARVLRRHRRRGDRVVVASDRARCLDARTGATLWEAAAAAAGADGDDYFWAPPVIAGRVVLVGSGAGSEATETRGRVTAYSLDDGRLLWSTPHGARRRQRRRHPRPAERRPPPAQGLRRHRRARTCRSPATTRAPTRSSSCACATARVVWADQVHAGDQLGLDLNSAPVLIGALVAVAGKDGFHAWNRRTRRRLWHVQTTPGSPAPGAPADPTTGPEGGPIASDGTARLRPLERLRGRHLRGGGDRPPERHRALADHAAGLLVRRARRVARTRSRCRAPTARCGCSTPRPARSPPSSRSTSRAPVHRASPTAACWSAPAPGRSCPVTRSSAFGARSRRKRKGGGSHREPPPRIPRSRKAAALGTGVPAVAALAGDATRRTSRPTGSGVFESWLANAGIPPPPFVT